MFRDSMEFIDTYTDIRHRRREAEPPELAFRGRASERVIRLHLFLDSALERKRLRLCGMFRDSMEFI